MLERKRVEPQPPAGFRVVDWGLIEYKAALKRQLEMVEQVRSGAAPETFVLCSHPPVVTLGRRTNEAEEGIQWQGPVVHVSRGGRATYHGPSQLVIYPILDLRREHAAFPPRDVHRYMRWLEHLMIDLLGHMGITAQPGSVVADKTGDKELDKSYTGVWVGFRKIASIGIGVKSWITYHGVALNLFEDAQAFTGIQPCGFSRETMTSLEAVLGRRPLDLRSEVIAALRDSCLTKEACGRPRHQ